MHIMKKEGILKEASVCSNTKLSKAENNLNMRVAAYCRVSTKLEMQESSLKVQMEAYERLIQEHEGWKIANIYIDKGISGTSTINRVGFNRMIEDARNGKIDIILAKSLSRFARNTLDTLQYTRELKKIGVYVYFEKEKIDTSDTASEILLTIFAAFAQEESHSISENTKKGIRNKFKLGQPRYSRILGYGKEWKMNDDAWIVKRIFELALDGKSKREIADILNKEETVSISGINIWSPSTIQGILRNEKYIGDVHMQKTFVGDYMLHNKVYNRDLIIDAYYKENHHEAIIDKCSFKNLIFETNLKRGRYGADQTPYYGILKCPQCKRNMVKIPGIYSDKRSMWVCPGKNMAGTLEERRTCDKIITPSTEIDKALNNAINEMCVQSDFENEINKFKKLIATTGSASYCRVAPVIRSMTINNNKLIVEWKMGWTAEYNMLTIPDVEKKWISIARAHIEDIDLDGVKLYKVNHPFRKKKE